MKSENVNYLLKESSDDQPIKLITSHVSDISSFHDLQKIYNQHTFSSWNSLSQNTNVPC